MLASFSVVPMGTGEALKTAAPELDVSRLSLDPLGEGQGSIVFDGEMLFTAE